MLKIENLNKYFGGVKAVNKCFFNVQKQTITALVGPNGAGKSTVFNLVSGILPADSGRIIFDERNITNLPPEKISNLGVSRLFQQTRLFNNLTVEENLLLAMDTEDTKFFKNLFGLNKTTEKKQEKVKTMLRTVGLEKFENILARELSYGQKRLIEISRVILKPHKFLMLDEPVSGVTPKLRQEIVKILLKLKEQGETILLIEHDMGFTFKVADVIIVMRKGAVITQGKQEEIKNDPKVLDAYLGE